MRVKCEYCENWISDTDKICPVCGAPNLHHTRAATGVPRTIQELKDFAAAHNIPVDRMRVFIGENYSGPRAFGIYEENGKFIVYKNKTDGTRAVRYRGTDEAYAVNELYQKMRSEMADQKNRRAARPPAAGRSAPPNRNGGSRRRKRRGGRPFLRRFWLIFIIVIFIAGIFEALVRSPDNGYYDYGGRTYYYQGGGWYYYDDYDGWYEVDPPYELEDDYSDYYISSYYSDDYDVENFYYSDYYYESDYSYDDDYDYDYDYDYDDDWDWDWDDDDWDWDDSWDSDWDTDWDSDW